jgi:hypothetical protein
MVLVLAVFSIVFNELTSKADTFSKRDPTTVAGQAINLFIEDFKKLEQLEFQNPSALFLKVFPNGIKDFINNKIVDISYSYSDIDNATATIDSDGFLTITPIYFKTSSMWRLGTIVHEIRHLDSIYHHVDCNFSEIEFDGKLYKLNEFNNPSGLGCDKSELGAYGVGYIFLRSIVESCTNCTSEMKDSARFWSNQTFLRIVNKTDRDHLIEGANNNKIQAIKDMKSFLTLSNKNFCIENPIDSHGYHYFYDGKNIDSANLRAVYDGSLIEIKGYETIYFQGKPYEGVKILVWGNKESTRKTDDPALDFIMSEHDAKYGDILWEHKKWFNCKSLELQKNLTE